MSVPLTDSAPDEAVDDSPVGDEGVDEVIEVDEVGSEPAEASVSQARFDGLMATMNRKENEAKARIKDLELQLQAASAGKDIPPEEDVTDALDIEALIREATATAVAQALAGQAGASRRQAILDAHPEVKANFADLLRAENDDDYEALVKDFDSRLKAAKGTPPAGAGDPPKVEADDDGEMPSLGGQYAAGSPEGEALETRRQEAIKNRDFAELGKVARLKAGV